jgi:hypothetical protein
MKIDLQATAERIRHLRPSEIAAHCGATPSLVWQVINGRYPHMAAPKAQAVVTRLRELGVLVEVDDDSHADRLAA